MNESLQWLGVPHFLMTYRPPWTDNILDPSPAWRNGGTTTNTNWGSKRHCCRPVEWSGIWHAGLRPQE